MDTGEVDGEFGDDLWGADCSLVRACTDVSDESDFTPAQLKIMKSKTLDQAAPLPKGVRDVGWQPPTSTGLHHSAPIFETESDTRGRLRMTSVGLSASNCHFRSWQEDNGIADSFGAEKVLKNVDGEKRIVSIGCVKASAGPGALLSPRTTDVLTHLKEIKRLSMRSNDSTDTCNSSKPSQEGDSPVQEGDAAGSSSTDADGSAQQLSTAPLRPSTGAASDSTQETGCAQSSAQTRGGNESPVGSSASPSMSMNDASDQQTSPTPRRPSDSVASSRARQPRPGRSRSTKVWE